MADDPTRQYRKGTRTLTPGQRALADEIETLAHVLYEAWPDMTRAEAVEAATRFLGDRPAVLVERASALYDAHADLTWRQALDGAALQLGYL
ncbi:hypothetical protein ACFU7Z_13595 [Kitasatospora sp. NPDC057518]|uniref:hypothetical protein n=1 Tax=Kitasatospora sp. NPDC057518 TaxID=3346155 RepID=UPI0036A036BE